MQNFNTESISYVIVITLLLPAGILAIRWWRRAPVAERWWVVLVLLSVGVAFVFRRRPVITEDPLPLGNGNQLPEVEPLPDERVIDIDKPLVRREEEADDPLPRL